MTRFVECPECERRIRISAELIGKKVKCPSCAKAFVANAALELGDAPPTRQSDIADDRELPARKSTRPLRRTEEDDDWEEAAQRPSTKRRKKARSSSPPWIIGACMAAAVLLMAVGGTIYLVAKRGGSGSPLLGPAGGGAGTGSAAWQTLTSSRFACTFSMPGTPKIEHEKDDDTYTIEIENQMIMFGCMFSDHTNSRQSADAYVRARLQELASKGKIVQRAATWGGQQCIEVEYQIPNKGQGIIRLYVRGNHSYTAGVFARTGATLPKPDVDRFFGSFTFAGK